MRLLFLCIANYEDEFRKALGAKRTAEAKKELSAKKRALQKSENRISELDRLFKRIYEDMVNGKLSEARFQMLSDDYEQEQEELRAEPRKSCGECRYIHSIGEEALVLGKAGT